MKIDSISSFVYALSLFYIALFPATTSAAERPWQLSLTANAGKWITSDIENSGTQSQVLTQLAYRSDRWGAAITARGVSTTYNTTLHPDDLSLNTLTNTNVTTYYSCAFGQVTIRGGVDIDLPTGKSSYSTEELSKIITDPVSSDLMILNSYGTGYDIAPHFVIVYEFSDSASIGAGGRYQFNGSYDPVSDLEDGELDPGDTILALVNAAYSVTDDDLITLLAIFADSRADLQNGQKVFDKGATYIGEARYIRKWTDSFQSIINFTIKGQEKNRVLNEGGVLNSEQVNSNNNLWELYLHTYWRITDLFAITGIIGYKSVDPNKAEIDSGGYDAGRNKTYVEPGFMVFFSDKFYVTGKFRYSRLSDKKDAFSSVDAEYDVLNGDLAMVYTF